jgi:hypothetical protein
MLPITAFIGVVALDKLFAADGWAELCDAVTRIGSVWMVTLTPPSHSRRPLRHRGEPGNPPGFFAGHTSDLIIKGSISPFASSSCLCRNASIRLSSPGKGYTTLGRRSSIPERINGI